jgi:hypothetical protein
MTEIKATITVVDKGTLKKATDSVHSLKRGIDQTTKSAKDLGPALHNLEKGTFGIGSAGQNFAKLARSINGGDNSLVGAYATLAANVFSITAAFQALKEAAQFQQVQAGLELMGNRLGYTLSNASARVKELSGGLLSTEQSMRSTAQVIAAGFKTDDLERLTKVAKDTSFALGRDMTESMDRLTRGVIKLEPELLDELGIMTRLDDANKVYARSLNKTAAQLTLTEKRQAFLTAALAEGELKFGGISEAGKGLTGLQELAATFNDLTKAVLGFVNKAVIPLASVFGASPGALGGVLVMFASTISKNLIPGLADLEEKTLKLATAKKAELAVDIAAFQFSGKRNDTITIFQEKLKAGTLTAKDYTDSLEDLRSQISVVELAKGKLQDSTGKFTTAAKYVPEKQGFIAAIEDLQNKQLEADKATAMSQAVTAASAKQLTIAYTQLSAAIVANNALAKANGATMLTLSGIFKMLTLAASNLGLALKVIGAGLLGFLNVIGLVIVAASLATDAIKFLYTAMVGKEVIEARKAINAITEGLAKQTLEYNRIREASGNIAMKEVMAAELLSNSFIQQGAAIDALRKAEEARDRKKKASKEATPEERAINDRIKTAAKVGDNIFGGLSSPSKQLAEQLRSDVPEVKAAALEVVGGVNNIVKVLKSEELAGDAIKQLTERFKDMGPALRELTTNLKATEDAYSDFIKSATPTTAYDKIVQELSKTSDSLTDNIQLMAEGKLTAEQLSNTLTSMGSITLAQTSGEVRQLVAELKRLEEANNALANAKNPLEWLKAKLDVDSITKRIESSRTAVIRGLQAEIFLQKDKAKLLQNQSIAITGQLAMAQAQLTTVSGYNDLSGKGTMDRMKAENSIKALQSQQLSLQAKYLEQIFEEQKYRIIIAEAELESNNRLAEKLGLQLRNLDILQLSAELVRVSETGTKAQVEAVTAQIDALQALNSQKTESARLQASILSTQQQAAAALAGSHRQAEIAAAGEATYRKTLSTIASQTLTILEEEFKFREASLKLQETEMGGAKDMVAQYDLLLKRQQDTLEARKTAIAAETEATVASLRAQAVAAAASNGGAKNAELYETQIRQAIVLRDIKIAILDTTDRQARLDLIGMKTAEELGQETLDRLNQELDILTKTLDARKELSSATRELDAINRRLNNTPESKLQQLQTAAKIAQEEYDYGVATFTLKQATIDAEYALLDAKLVAEAKLIEARNKNLMSEYSSGGITKAEYEKQLGTSQQGLANINSTRAGIAEAAKTAKDASAKFLELLGARLKEAQTPTSLSGGRIDASNLFDFENMKFDKLVFAQLGLLEAGSEIDKFTEKFKELGPNGEAVSAFVSGSLVIADAAIEMSKAFTTIQESLTGNNTDGLLGGIKAFADAGAAAAGSLNTIYQASAKAKIAAIDSEISAEQKRDGKSSESVAKLATLEKKKDSMAKKAFEVNKKLMIAQAIMATASGVVGALGMVPFTPFNIAMAGVVGAMGAAQVALIAGTQYQSTASAAALSQPSSISIGKRGSSVDLARNNMNTGGELGYLTGSTGYGNNAQNFTRRAYGGPARAGMVVGEKGPELFVPSVPGTVVSNDNMPGGGSINANITIQAIDAEGVEQVLTNNKGHIIGMLREAANASGQGFLESVNTNKYRRGGTRL